MYVRFSIFVYNLAYLFSLWWSVYQVEFENKFINVVYSLPVFMCHSKIFLWPDKGGGPVLIHCIALLISSIAFSRISGFCVVTTHENDERNTLRAYKCINLLNTEIILYESRKHLEDTEKFMIRLCLWTRKMPRTEDKIKNKNLHENSLVFNQTCIYARLRVCMASHRDRGYERAGVVQTAEHATICALTQKL